MKCDILSSTHCIGTTVYLERQQRGPDQLEPQVPVPPCWRDQGDEIGDAQQRYDDEQRPGRLPLLLLLAAAGVAAGAAAHLVVRAELANHHLELNYTFLKMLFIYFYREQSRSTRHKVVVVVVLVVVVGTRLT